MSLQKSDQAHIPLPQLFPIGGARRFLADLLDARVVLDPSITPETGEWALGELEAMAAAVRAALAHWAMPDLPSIHPLPLPGWPDGAHPLRIEGHLVHRARQGCPLDRGAEYAWREEIWTQASEAWSGVGKDSPGWAPLNLIRSMIYLLDGMLVARNVVEDYCQQAGIFGRHLNWGISAAALVKAPGAGSTPPAWALEAARQVVLYAFIRHGARLSVPVSPLTAGDLLMLATHSNAGVREIGIVLSGERRGSPAARS